MAWGPDYCFYLSPLDGVFGYLESFEEHTVRLRVDKDEVNSDNLSNNKELIKVRVCASECERRQYYDKERNL